MVVLEIVLLNLAIEAQYAFTLSSSLQSSIFLSVSSYSSSVLPSFNSLKAEASFNIAS
jgi:hypothetical protein